MTPHMDTYRVFTTFKWCTCVLNIYDSVAYIQRSNNLLTKNSKLIIKSTWYNLISIESHPLTRTWPEQVCFPLSGWLSILPSHLAGRQQEVGRLWSNLWCGTGPPPVGDCWAALCVFNGDTMSHSTSFWIGLWGIVNGLHCTRLYMSSTP